jgi:hypothetical protein
MMAEGEFDIRRGSVSGLGAGGGAQKIKVTQEAIGF